MRLKAGDLLGQPLTHCCAYTGCLRRLSAEYLLPVTSAMFTLHAVYVVGQTDYVVERAMSSVDEVGSGGGLARLGALERLLEPLGAGISCINT